MASSSGDLKPSLGAVPNPDPTVRTVEQLQRDIGASREIVEGKVNENTSLIHSTREILETRLAAMDKAIELLQATTNKLPAFIKDEVMQLRDLHQEKFNSMAAQADIQFDGIKTQFIERDKRTEQLSLSDKTAIAAALQAQKEAAGATNDSNSVALLKMETNFAKLIDQGQALLNAVNKNLDEKITALTSRLDRGEGKTSVSDPAVGAALQSLEAQIVNGQKPANHNVLIGTIIGAAVLLFVALIASGLLIHFAKG